MSDIELRIEPLRAALPAGKATSLDVLVSVSAPAVPAAMPRRGSLNLALVLDRSGSMRGVPLQEAVRCAEFIIGRLDQRDFASIVVYDDEPRILVPAQQVLRKEIFQSALQEVRAGGMTALHAGWLKGAEQAALYSREAEISRVLLLSDGQANVGLQSVDEIASHCSRMADAGVSTSAYGLGISFNEALMSAIARAGRGNSYYGETAQDLIDPFTQEFDLLSALFARDLRLELQPAENVSATVVNDYPRCNGGAWMLPDLPYGGEAWALVTVKTPAASDSNDLLNLQVRYRLMGDAADRAATACLALPGVDAAAYAEIPEKRSVARRVGELNAAALQREARQAAERGDWVRVDALLAKARQEAANNEWVAASLETLEGFAKQRDMQRFAKEAHFKAQRLGTRIVSADEDAAYSPAMESAVPSYLRRKKAEGRKHEP